MDLYPNNLIGLWICSVLYTDLELYDKALTKLQKLIILMDKDNISDEIGLLGYIYGKLGQRDKAETQLDILDELSSEGYYISPRTRVWVHMGLIEIEKAIEVIKQSIDDHTFNPYFFRFYPREFVQNDSLFIELQKNIGLI